MRTNGDEKRPVNLNDFTWNIEAQGDLVKVTAVSRYVVPKKHGKRKHISSFSRPARLRLLKFVAIVAWPKIKHGLFITLTYPDDLSPFDPKQRTKELFLFLRYLEDHQGKQVCALWRIEWKPRLSGKRKGQLMPHTHLILPGCKFVPKETVRRWWKTILGKTTYVATSVESLTSKRMHAVYIAKYAAKIPPTDVLDNPSYSNISGRHYGYRRKQLIPLAEKTEYASVGYKGRDALRSIASDCLPWYDLRYDTGFSLIGKLGAMICRLLAEGGLDVRPDID